MLSLYDDFELSDGIYFPRDNQLIQRTGTKELWEEAAQGWIKTGYASGKPGGIWNRFPMNYCGKTIVELGCGYGRHISYLSKERGLTCDEYYGFDISEGMLRRLLSLKQEINFLANSSLYIICMALGEIPVADNSADLVMSSSVFMHLKKTDVSLILSEVYRILKPGGVFIFNDSFHNKLCPTHVVYNLIQSSRLSGVKSDIYLKQYTYSEIAELLIKSNIAQKCPNYIITPSHFEAIPSQLHKGKWIKDINNFLIKKAPKKLANEVLASAYSVYSDKFFEVG